MLELALILIGGDLQGHGEPHGDRRIGQHPEPFTNKLCLVILPCLESFSNPSQVRREAEAFPINFRLTNLIRTLLIPSEYLDEKAARQPRRIVD